MTRTPPVSELLYPPIAPHRSGMLAVDDLHTLYWEECGVPAGVPVLFLHGGPGSGCSPVHRRFFDPGHYRIVLFDQRGAGRSTPLGEVRGNATDRLVADIERLREHLGIADWLVFGGSWGSTLALAYGQAHPERCRGFVLRGIFLCTPPEIEWFVHGMRWFFPEAHDEWVAALPASERDDPLSAYAQRLFGIDDGPRLQAARAWRNYEDRCVQLRPQPLAAPDAASDLVALGVGRLEVHYFQHQGFFSDDQLIRGVDRIRHLPASIVQGRYDVVCPPRTAWRLHRAWPGAAFELVDDAGHSAFEPGIARALVAATDRFRDTGGFRPAGLLPE
ncbi:MAG: prolyl aminopeptidase [Rhodoferax sp.]|nr:prolyl aminopeptidase [Rhodoferax sp.]